MLIDSHCHLDFPDFADDREAVIARAKARGIGRLITISTRVAPGDTPERSRRSATPIPDQTCSLHHPPVQSITAVASRRGSSARSAKESSAGRLTAPLTRRRHAATSIAGTVSRLQMVTGNAFPLKDPA